MFVPDRTPDDMVIMDNLLSHKRGSDRVRIEAAGARLLFLPACLPDLGPIGKASPVSRPCFEMPDLKLPPRGSDKFNGTIEPIMPFINLGQAKAERWMDRQSAKTQVAPCGIFFTEGDPCFKNLTH